MLDAFQVPKYYADIIGLGPSADHAYYTMAVNRTEEKAFYRFTCIL